MNRTKKTMKVAIVFALAFVLLANAFMPMAVKGSGRDNSAEYQYYAVKVGDTLTRIAKNNGVTISDIMTANNLSDADHIRAGQVLKVPVSSASASSNTLANSRVSMRLVDANVKDVISAIALNAGYTVIMEKSAKDNNEKITVNLEEMSVLKAIDTITRLVDLTYLKDGNTLMIGTADGLNTTFVDKTVLSKITLNYISAEALQAQMGALGLSNVQMVATNNKDEFYISGYPKELAKVTELKKLLDVSSNIMAGGGSIPSHFTSLDLKYINASEFNGLLGNLGLSQGIVLASRPYTLYVYVTGANLADIKTIQKIVDQPLSGANLDALHNGAQNGGGTTNPDTPVAPTAPATKPEPTTPTEPAQPAPETKPETTNAVLRQIQLNVINRTEAEKILKSFPLQIQIYGPEKYTKSIWIAGAAAELDKAEGYIAQFDNADYASSALRGDTEFFVYDLMNCTAAEMLDRLSNLQLDGVTFRANGTATISKSLFVFCPSYLKEEATKLLEDMDVAATASTKTNYVVESNKEEASAQPRINALQKLYPELADASVYEFTIQPIPDKSGEIKYITYVKTTAEGINYVRGLFAEMDSAA